MVRSSFEVTDEASQTKMTIDFEGPASITPEVFFRCVSQVRREHPELGGKDSQEYKDELELKELKKKSPETMTQKEFSRWRSLETKKRSEAARG